MGNKPIKQTHSMPFNALGLTNIIKLKRVESGSHSKLLFLGEVLVPLYIALKISRSYLENP